MKKTLLIAALLLPGIAAADDAPRNVMRATTLHKRGLQSLDAGDLDKAKQYFEQAIGVIPFYAEAHLGLGQVAMREQRFGEALAEFQKARDGYKEGGEMRFRLEEQRYRAARDQISQLRDQLSSIQRPSSMYKSTESKQMQSVTDLETKIRQLEEIPMPMPGGPAPEAPGEVHFHIGSAYFRLGKLEEARREWDACVERSPDFPLVYNNLAVLDWKEGKPAEALLNIERAERHGFKVNADFKAEVSRAAGR